MNKRELLYALRCGAAVMLLTCVPPFVMWFITPLDGVFPGILFNSDDIAVYFSWMRQAHDGHLLFRNLFTTEPQRGVYPQLYFLLLGWVARLPGLDLPLTYHLARFFFGTLTLVLAYRLGAFFTEDVFTRRCIFWVTALSAGLGWLAWANHVLTYEPVDVWQPEALTFPSLYANGLFCAALALMLGIVICLLLAEERGWPWAAGAGVCGLVLGNVHSYDVIHLSLAWGGYLLSRWVVERRFPTRALGHACLAAAITAPSVVYMAWLYRTEPIFRARADTATWSHNPVLYLVGYGLLLPLAVYGCMGVWVYGCMGVGESRTVRLQQLVEPLVVGVIAFGASAIVYQYAPDWRRFIPVLVLAVWGWTLFRLRQRTVGVGKPKELGLEIPQGTNTTPPQPPTINYQPSTINHHSHTPTHPHTHTPTLLPIAWAFTGLAAAYLPFAFQRKMVMGEHFPLALLAGIAVADLSRRVAARFARPRLAPAFAALVVGSLSISNVRWLVRDLSVAFREGVTSTGIHPAFWPASEIHAFEWMGRHTGPHAALLTHPFAGVFAPAFSGRTVYAGHWGETPHFNARRSLATEFYWGLWSSQQRLQFLQANGITHVLWGPSDRSYLMGLPPKKRPLPPLRPLFSEPFLKPVFTEGEAVLYEVQAPRPGSSRLGRVHQAAHVAEGEEPS